MMRDSVVGRVRIVAAAGDISAWRRENSNAVLVLVVLSDGTEIRGTMLIPRDKSMREVMIQPEAFFDIECQINGPVLVAKNLVRTMRAIEMPKADQLDLSLKALEKMDVYGILKLDKTTEITAEMVKIAARDQMKRFPIPLGGTSVLPQEVLDYITVMRKRIEVARTELVASITAAAEKAAQKEANVKAMARPSPGMSAGNANGGFGNRIKPAA